jgi:CMP-N-acetylneuraminic acid synthetase
MEQRITTLEEVTQTVLAALRAFNESMRRYHAAALLRDEAILRAADSIQQLQTTVQQLQGTTELLHEAQREAADALERQDEAIGSLLAFVPLSQAEIVRLDSRIDNLEGA